MTNRVTKTELDHTARIVTTRMHEYGVLHPDAEIRVGGEYGYTVAEITGGPFYHSGSSSRLTAGTKREVSRTLHAISRALESGQSSKG